MLPLGVGDAYIIDNYHSFVHYIDTVNLANNYKTMMKNFIICKLTYNSAGYKFESEQILIRRKSSQMRNSLKQVTVNLRNERGLLNIIGSAIKVIIGSMYHVDADKINNALEELRLEESETVKVVNNQGSLNVHF